MGKTGWGYAEAQVVQLQFGVRWRGMHVRGLLKAGRDGKIPVPQLSKQVVGRLQALREKVPTGG
jgi:hypothetical protein